MLKRFLLKLLHFAPFFLFPGFWAISYFSPFIGKPYRVVAAIIALAFIVSGISGLTKFFADFKTQSSLIWCIPYLTGLSALWVGDAIWKEYLIIANFRLYTVIGILGIGACLVAIITLWRQTIYSSVK